MIETAQVDARGNSESGVNLRLGASSKPRGGGYSASVKKLRISPRLIGEESSSVA